MSSSSHLRSCLARSQGAACPQLHNSFFVDFNGCCKSVLQREGLQGDAFSVCGAGLCRCVHAQLCVSAREHVTTCPLIPKQRLPAGVHCIICSDQVMDLLLVANLIASDKPRSTVTGLASLFFVLLFGITAGLKAVGEGRGIIGCMQAASGVDIGLRYAQCQESDVTSRWTVLDKAQCHHCTSPIPTPIPPVTLCYGAISLHLCVNLEVFVDVHDSSWPGWGVQPPFIRHKRAAAFGDLLFCPAALWPRL